MPLDEIREARLGKLKKLKEEKIDPYPARTSRTHEIREAIEGFDDLAGEKEKIMVAGRILGKRGHGGSAFLDIADSTGRIQLLFKKDILGEDAYELFKETVDTGDFIEASGFLFRTKQAEMTIEVEGYSMLTKSLLPLPEKWHGLQDVEERYRKRYLDLIFNAEVKEKFKLRSRIIESFRNFLNVRGFMEVVTPTLQPMYGGASARPFKTHMHDLDMDLFLRIAPELYLKRLLVGGFERVFEFTTNFRNEGMDRDHNPEFSVLEFYAAYKDLEWLMDFTEDLFEDVLTRVFVSLKIKTGDMELDFQKPYQRFKFNDLLKERAGIDYSAAGEEEFRAKAKELGVKIDKTVSKPGLADEIFKKAITPGLIQPTFVTQWPADILPLAKRSDDSDYVGAFQFFAGGREIIKAFSELNDPIDQRERFKAQENRRAKGDEEAQRLDEDFLEALEYGMPPAAGWGLGIDRFVALLTDSHSIREIILFPLMKPRDND